MIFDKLFNVKGVLAGYYFKYPVAGNLKDLSSSPLRVTVQYLLNKLSWTRWNLIFFEDIYKSHSFLFMFSVTSFYKEASWNIPPSALIILRLLKKEETAKQNAMDEMPYRRRMTHSRNQSV